jgi:hypothetical protein
MDAAAWMALAGVVVTVCLNVGAPLIGWGVLKGTVTALGGRVTALEREMRALEELKLDVARLQTRMDTLIDQVRDLNAAIRWMREPADPRRLAPPAGV